MTIADSAARPEPQNEQSTRSRRFRSRLNQAYAAEGHAGLRLAVKGRSIALLAVAVLLFFLTPFPGVFYYHALIAVFLASGLLQGWLSGTGRRRVWQDYAFVAFDFALLTFTLIAPNFLAETVYPSQLTFRFGNFIYFFLLLGGLAFSYQPRLVLWGGAVGALTWTAGVLWVLKLPDSTFIVPEDTGVEGMMQFFADPGFVDLGVRLQEVVIFLIVAGLLAAAVLRSQRLVLRQAQSERERGNLARHFPPSMVDRLARMDAPLSQVREQRVAVLFADIVGFTRWSERRSPTEVIALLREVHGRLESLVFNHGGTLDKFIGDGVLATFGTPETSPRDAADALACARAALSAFEAWNAARATRGEEPLRLSIGLHYGPVVTGDIGSERRLEFAVLGDTVNVASRLEQLSRELDCRAVISDAAVAAARDTEGGDALLQGLERRPDQRLRGREQPVGVWVL